MAVVIPVHDNNTSLKTIGYGSYLASGAAYTVYPCYNTSGQFIPFKTLVTVNSVSGDGRTITTAAHGTINLFPWEPFPFSFNVSLAGTTFNSYAAEFNTFISKSPGRYTVKNGAGGLFQYATTDTIIAPPSSPPPPPPVGGSLSIVSAALAANGTSLTIVLSGVAPGHEGFALVASGGFVSPTYSSGDGTNTLVYTLSRTVASSETLRLFYVES